MQTDGAANPSLPFPYNDFFNPAEQQAWESFWSNADAPNGIGLENNYSQMLEYVANAFNGNSNVAGFELMNEPSPGSSTFLSTLFGSPFFDSQQLTPFYDQGADAIRAVDPSTPIFFEPNLLSNAGLPTDLGTRGRHEHRLVVPRLLRVRPGAAGLHTERQRGRRQRRGLRAGAWNSGIHDASSARPATKRRSRPRCKEPTST